MIIQDESQACVLLNNCRYNRARYQNNFQENIDKSKNR